ncbi:hypothetical protein [Frigoribacterium salinisoli]
MTGRRSGVPAAPVSYALSIPLGWIRLPGRLDREATIQAVLDQVDDVEAGVPGWRDELGSVLDDAFRVDTGRRVLDAYVPQGALPGTRVSCSVVVSVVDLAPPGGDPDRLLLHRAAVHGGELLDLDGSPAVRWAEPPGRGRGATPARGNELARDHVLARIPGRSDLLLGITASVVSDDAHDATTASPATGQLVEALRLVFAAMTSSFSWVAEPLGSSNPRS